MLAYWHNLCHPDLEGSLAETIFESCVVDDRNGPSMSVFGFNTMDAEINNGEWEMA